MEQLWTVEQAAQYLQVHSETVRRMIRRGELPYTKAGSVYRIDPSDLRKERAPKRESARSRDDSPLARFTTREWREACRDPADDSGGV